MWNIFRVKSKDTRKTPLALFWGHSTPCSSFSIVNFGKQVNFGNHIIENMTNPIDIFQLIPRHNLKIIRLYHEKYGRQFNIWTAHLATCFDVLLHINSSSNFHYCENNSDFLVCFRVSATKVKLFIHWFPMPLFASNWKYQKTLEKGYTGNERVSILTLEAKMHQN